MVTKSNATRFINAYNVIDYSLRNVYNFKSNMAFSDLIRRCASLNSVIAKFEDNLLDYARLRNAIVHRSSDTIIAEPHLEVVESLEKIAKLISTPPVALNTVCTKNVMTVDANLSVKDVIITMAETGFSNIPVYRGGTLVGVANGQKILNAMGGHIENGNSINDWIIKTKIENVVKLDPNAMHFTVVDVKITVEEALNLFNSNRKLLCILITRTGSFLEQPIGIMTSADVIDMHKILENY